MRIRYFLLIFASYISCVALGAEAFPDSISGKDLGEVVVTGMSARQRIDNSQLGAERLELSKLTRLPAFGGEADIIKSIVLLPGVHSEGDGGGGFEVRGGNASQNLVMLDGITLYNPSHVMGIFSTFNENALGRATLYKGPIPAWYGGATSSVLETTLAPGDMESFHGAATVGILAAKIKAEGPIVKDKLSFSVTGRRSYVDAFLKLIPEYRSTVMNFYDVTAKLRYRPSSGHMIDASFFASRDNMAVAELMGMYWGNIGASFNWLARIKDRFSMTTTMSFTHFNPKMAMSIMNEDEDMTQYIRSYSLNERIGYVISPDHRLEMGVRSELLKVKSAEWIFNGSHEKEIRSLWDNALWINYEGNFLSRLEVSAGLRLDIASVMSGRRFHEYISSGDAPSYSDGKTKTYVDAGPRVSVKYSISRLHNIKAGMGIAMQNLHAIRSNATSFPFDRYALTSAEVRPERAVQYGIGYAGMTSGGDYDWSVEGYYKKINNIYDYEDGRNSFSDIRLEEIILGGRGRSYGAEFMLRKNTGRFTGWISYTLSHTQTKIPGINDDKWYDATNDRRHDFAITAIYALSDKWSFSGSWIYSSGQPLTAPDVKYEIAGSTCYYYSKRNGYLTPSTHRLDLSAVYTHVGRKFTYQWSVGVYNTYCRYNPYVVYFEDDPSKPSGTRAVLQAMYGIVPSVSYTIKF